MIWRVTNTILLLENGTVFPSLAYEATCYPRFRILGEETKRGKPDGEHVQPWQTRVFPGDRRGLADDVCAVMEMEMEIPSSSRESDKELERLLNLTTSKLPPLDHHLARGYI